MHAGSEPRRLRSYYSCYYTCHQGHWQQSSGQQQQAVAAGCSSGWQAGAVHMYLLPHSPLLPICTEPCDMQTEKLLTRNK